MRPWESQGKFWPMASGKKEGPGFPGPWVACNRLSVFSLAGQMTIVKTKIERAFSPRLFGEERRPLGTAGAAAFPRTWKRHFLAYARSGLEPCLRSPYASSVPERLLERCCARATSLRLTDGGFTILSYPAILSLYTAVSPRMFPREAAR